MTLCTFWKKIEEFRVWDFWKINFLCFPSGCDCLIADTSKLFPPSLPSTIPRSSSRCRSTLLSISCDEDPLQAVDIKMNNIIVHFMQSGSAPIPWNVQRKTFPIQGFTNADFAARVHRFLENYMKKPAQPSPDYPGQDSRFTGYKVTFDQKRKSVSFGSVFLSACWPRIR